MLISLTWLRDFIDLPPDLDPKALGLRFTVTAAEVDAVHEVRVSARGLIAAKVRTAKDLSTTGRKLRLVTLDIGGGKTMETVSAAPDLPVGSLVVFAPPSAHVASLGDINVSSIAGHASHGLILPGDALGIEKAVQEAVFLGPEFQPGDALPSDLFDDWLIEIDNKSITNRPDLWGHYGVAREVAALLNLPLNPYDNFLTPEADLHAAREKIPIRIADPAACRRFCVLRFDGVPARPAPLWMQLRLGRVGLRPISGLVDLTNYIMCELGQPMHAFDADKVTAIEVDFAHDGEIFTTLDGVDRKLTRADLMVQSRGISIGLAGVMGGRETEVTARTTSLLLECANFHPAVIRRTASRLGLRTDASARFEKSLDPLNTVLAIRRFINLARHMYPKLRLTSALSDAFPGPLPPVRVTVNPRHAARVLGRNLTAAEAVQQLAPLGFAVTDRGSSWDVDVPSFRATGDVSIEADVIEELARRIGYAGVKPAMPVVEIRRFPPNPRHDIARHAVAYLTAAHRFHEIHGYIWYDAAWLAKISAPPGPCAELRNPAADGLHLLRRSLMPGLLAATARNRFHFDSIALLEVGSVFEPAAGSNARDAECLHLGLVLARRARDANEDLLAHLKGAIESWTWNRLALPVRYARAAPDPVQPWVHPQRSACVLVNNAPCGTISVADVNLRRAMDEHLAAWSIAWAELRLDDLAALTPHTEKPAGIPPFPRVEMDVSFLTPAGCLFTEVVGKVTALRHPLLRQIRYVGSFTGGAVPEGFRSLTFRCVLGADRTLTDEDTQTFRVVLEAHLTACGYDLRKQ